MSRKELGLLVGLMAAALLIRMFFLSKVEVLLPDEAYYVRMGQHLADGGSFRDFDTVERMYKGQPLFSYLIGAGLPIGKDPVKIAQWISLFFAVVTLVPFHFCARLLSSSVAAFWSDLVYVLSPLFIHYSIWAMPHSLFNFFFLTGLFFTLKAQRSDRLSWIFLAAVAAWGFYMARAEGFFFAAVLAFAILAFTGRRQALAFSTLFVLLSFPFWLWLKKETGIWQLSWSEGLGASGMFLRRLVERQVALEPLTFFRFYLENLSESYSLLPKMLPLVAWIFVGMGMVELLRRDRTLNRSVFIVMSLVAFPFLFYPTHNVEPRFLTPSILSLAMFVGAGICSLGGTVKKWGRPMGLGLLILSFIPGYRSLWLGFKEEPMEQKRLGAWIQHQFETPQVILGSDWRTCFYAGPKCRRFVWMFDATSPLTEGPAFQEFLRAKKVDLIAADTRYLPKFFPTFNFLLKESPQGLKSLVQISEKENKITLYGLAGS